MGNAVNMGPLGGVATGSMAPGLELAESKSIKRTSAQQKAAYSSLVAHMDPPRYAPVANAPRLSERSAGTLNREKAREALKKEYQAKTASLQAQRQKYEADKTNMEKCIS